MKAPMECCDSCGQVSLELEEMAGMEEIEVPPERRRKFDRVEMATFATRPSRWCPSCAGKHERWKASQARAGERIAAAAAMRGAA